MWYRLTVSDSDIVPKPTFINTNALLLDGESPVSEGLMNCSRNSFETRSRRAPLAQLVHLDTNSVNRRKKIQTFNAVNKIDLLLRHFKLCCTWVMFRLWEVSGLHTSCRQPREDEPCGRRPAAITAPSLNCRWYGWRQRMGPCPAADPNPEVRAASTLCCRLTAAALGLKETPSRWLRPTSSPSLVCDVAEINTEVTDGSNRYKMYDLI